MNKCIENEIKEMLPDLLHRTLTADARARVDAHLASCEECREELEVLQTVKSAAVFAPVIDVDHVVRQIPPYRTIVPVVERPATTRVVSWLLAATMAIAVVGGGSLVLTRRQLPTAPPVVTIKPPLSGPTRPTPEPFGTPKSVSPSETVVASTAQPQAHTPALALAADVGGLSDGNLEQLMSEMARFDALPATEGDPVIFVDSSYNLDEDSR